MKNTEIASYSFKKLDIYRSTSELIEIQLKYFVFFPCTWRIKLLNASKNKGSLWQFQVTFHMYLDIERDNHDDCDDEESSDEDYYE